eukprot:TRINITY_DN25155_c1_g2_i1.p1 TRINITY_DN25155_c1_g2~~TRINITY_DN25155_c1_g2_i1.p1  ORF type:complete len:549 (-),score=78.65 TRINITY_DN25155_c1_g2_i1:229-1875(-)
MADADGAEVDGAEDLQGNLSSAQLLKHSPTNARRGCSDVLWIPIMLLQLSVVVGLITWRQHSGGLPHWFELSGYDGMCGKGVNIDKPYLYYCGHQRGNNSLAATLAQSAISEDMLQSFGLVSKDYQETKGNLWHFGHDFGVCVAACPTSNATMTTCPRRSRPGAARVMKQYHDYPSFAQSAAICVPTDPVMAADFSDWITARESLHFIVMALGLSHGCYTTAIAVLVTVVVCYLYIYVMREYAAELVWGILVLCFLCGLGGAVVLGQLWQAADANDEDQKLSHGLGFLACASVALLSMSFLCKDSKSIRVAGSCIEDACKASVQIRVIHALPVLASLSRLPLLFDLILRLAIYRAYLKTWDGAGPEMKMLSGLALVYVTLNTFMLTALVFSIMYFVISYVAQIWFFEGAANFHGCRTACAGLRKAFRYHLGSIILGTETFLGLLPLSLVLDLIGPVVAERSALGGILRGVCPRLKELYDFVNPYRLRALIPLAQRGGNYFDATQRAVDVMEVAAPTSTQQELRAALLIFEFVGLGLVAVCSYSHEQYA